ncbi:uncharacterized protein LOC126266139 [Aethina tumida]|uniref:uncharacterized protein LOC126266139 n=1 Tax=Aethina tumida TaxID=116153 RepID=UPI0021497492|nr:uncharacterized protein LOC126266139 [Aethina tumida]
MLDDREIIVCVKGYELNHISKPLSLDELKILMEFYAKWHSISIAMKTLEPQIWKNTIYNLNYWKSFIVEAPAMQIFSKFHKCMCRMLKSRNEHEMLKKIEMLDFVQIARESIQEDNELTVVVHADCWNNNYLFKYKDGNVNDVAVVDWQLSSLGYIQNDLSCCILSCISSNEINEVDTLLEFYYYQFSTSLTLNMV